MSRNETYASQLCDWLVELGYTHCFLLAGGNIMHLLEAVRTRFECIPVIHEVTAVIATEYFNETSNNGKAFALVTAGPGLTNCMNGVTGAWLESREVLLIGGQVKSGDLSFPGLRIRGIQEVDGKSLFKSVTKSAIRIEKPLGKHDVIKTIKSGSQGRPGPVYIEFCLDAQGAVPLSPPGEVEDMVTSEEEINHAAFANLIPIIREARRPVILLGGSVSRSVAQEFFENIDAIGIPVMTTWNAADRIPGNHKFNWGRPQSQGQRSANLLLQQSDLLIAIGTRLGLQQTGFNWKEFCPLAKVIQIFNDSDELKKGHPRVDFIIEGDPNRYLEMLKLALVSTPSVGTEEWLEYGTMVQDMLPLNESSNRLSTDFINPYDFVDFLCEALKGDEVIVSSSSGATFTLVMQTFLQKKTQKIVSSGALASMGYAVPGAIGAAFANPDLSIIVIDGDGGFAQSLYELGTIARSNLPIKIFIIDNKGYGSIRKTQESYFSGAYLGCDYDSGLGLPDWEKLFGTFGINYRSVANYEDLRGDLVDRIMDNSPLGVVIQVDPSQTYYPRIPNRVLPNGGMESAALHEMYPPPEDRIRQITEQYLIEWNSR
jgi:acetolactate synthase-1/2/3 large subunit